MYCTAPLSPRKWCLRSSHDDDDDYYYYITLELFTVAEVQDC